MKGFARLHRVLQDVVRRLLLWHFTSAQGFSGFAFGKDCMSILPFDEDVGFIVDG